MALLGPDIEAARALFADEMLATLAEAFALLTQLESRLLDIVLLSLRVSGSAVAIGAVIGLPVGAWVAVARFPGRGAVTVVLNAMMGLPSVIVGVIVYLALSRSGPAGSLGLLFTPTAMVIAQTVLTAPLMAALAREIVEDAWRDYETEFRALRLTRLQRVNERDGKPGLFYFHPWEVDPGQPRIQGAPLKSRFRHYLNLNSMHSRLERLLEDFEWGRMDEVFGI